ncbi:hypothetical protein [Alterisphingorhabdus coralli]|uniref:Uncharacterized protein n=1 Tax=Alterisphingorhabdus coralli TaxID=3071408 RepID=A0AA97I0W7_9SPHN|nr:hypothetical protein [Parasphingorhabdus sp. SCSIO 66989]WOE75437.1 hypothetical protein RB602_01605 [Parasphingorhabdus sp. SCSIO 66989]
MRGMPVSSITLLLLQGAALSATATAESPRHGAAKASAVATATIVRADSARGMVMEQTQQSVDHKRLIKASAQIRRTEKGALLVEYR